MADGLLERVEALGCASGRLRVAVLAEDLLCLIGVARCVYEYSASLFAVAARPADFLRVRVDAEGQTGVHNKPHIRAVDAQTEGVGRDNDGALLLEEVFVYELALLLGELAVVGFRRVAAAVQPLGRTLDVPDGRAVDDGRASSTTTRRTRAALSAVQTSSRWSCSGARYSRPPFCVKLHSVSAWQPLRSSEFNRAARRPFL